ncbi:hypothetical protein [Streptomyces sp. G45]|uniref:hypothetical protein n=1 Tax=Streptomyces sp. G45 TaxID=3406627 RepID=UPI003C267964
MRLLPWPNPDGGPCYLSTDDPTSVISRLADDIEEAQLASGRQVLTISEAILADAAAGDRTVRFALTRTVESLRDALRVADSRGDRIDRWQPNPPAAEND